MNHRFRFLWGQKQSAMITQAMLSQLLFDFDLNGSLIDSGISEDLFILKNGVFSHYMPLDSIKRLEHNAEKMLNPKFSRMISDKIDIHIKQFKTFSLKVQNTRYTNSTNTALARTLKKYQEFLNHTFAFFETSTPAGTSALIAEIQKIIKKKVKNPQQRQRYFIWLCSSDKADATMLERADFIKLTKAKSVSASQWRKYANQYPALFFNTYDESQIFGFLKNKWEEEKKADLRAELKLMRDTLNTNKARHKLVYSVFKSKKLKHLAKALQQTALDRYRLKHLWSGAEFLCLNLILELSKRTKTKVDDFVKTYTFTDIYNFLESGKRLMSLELNNRKKLLLYHYKKGHLKFLTGNQALRLQPTLLGKPHGVKKRESAKIIGTIANYGKVTAKIRVVKVKDLGTFNHDSRAFQNGEILVTTMTSPLMVPIVKKASGIISDEGGITSHAAVVAREFNIPCIVGTHGASSLLKTGDVVEVDANKGIVRILKRAK